MKTLRIVNADGTITEIHGYDAMGRDVHIDGPMSDLVVNYRPEGSIVDRIFPIVPVGKQSDLYYEFAQADILRVPDTTRAPLTAAKRVGFAVSSQTYFAKNYALATGIAIEDQVNADAALRLRESKSKFLTDLLTLDWELRVAQLVINSSNVGSVSTISSLWRDHTNADPTVDIDAAIERVRNASGYRPNRMVLGWEAFRHLKRNANVRALLFPAPGGTTPAAGIIRTEQVSNIFDFEQTLVGGMMRNTAAQNLPLALAEIWGPHVLLYYAPGAPSIDVPAYGYTFRWTRPGLPNMTVEEWYDQRVKGTMLDVGMYQDEKIVAKRFATVIASVV